MGLSPPLFGFTFSNFLVHFEITIDKFYNGELWQETGKKKDEYALFYYTLLEKAQHPIRIDWQQF